VNTPIVKPIKRLAIRGKSKDGSQLWLTDDGQRCDESLDFTPWGVEKLVTWTVGERDTAERHAKTVYCRRYKAKVVTVKEYPGGVYEK
jgi:hypothetical protein